MEENGIGFAGCVAGTSDVEKEVDAEKCAEWTLLAGPELGPRLGGG